MGLISLFILPEFIYCQKRMEVVEMQKENDDIGDFREAKLTGLLPDKMG